MTARTIDWGSLLRRLDPEYDLDRAREVAYEFKSGAVERTFRQPYPLYGLMIQMGTSTS